MIHHPQRDLCNAYGEFLDFDTVELVYVNLGQLRRIEPSVSIKLNEHLGFERAQLTIGYDKKVAAATCRIETANVGELFLELIARILDPLACGLDVVDADAWTGALASRC